MSIKTTPASFRSSRITYRLGNAMLARLLRVASTASFKDGKPQDSEYPHVESSHFSDSGNSTAIRLSASASDSGVSRTEPRNNDACSATKLRKSERFTSWRLTPQFSGR